ncbi:hypothetical protein [Brevibacillus dissolubilis]|uniref:hypothetical protein n=1 Tax=Brevibacillus dissolubilis TaxID=1844116 RepID=UPI0011162FA2|nr:hypothetical protein [Brevibacillus dissolubilis]
MKVLSITGEAVPAGKGGSPSDTFDRSMVTYESDNATKSFTVTYPRYFDKVLAERGIYDQEKEGVPVSRIVAILYVEKHPNVRESRTYYNDTEQFLTLFEGFSFADFKSKYGSLASA